MVKFLLPRSRVSLENDYGWTALEYACMSGNFKTVELLIPYMNIAHKSRNTALMCALKGLCIKSLKLGEIYSFANPRNMADYRNIVTALIPNCNVCAKDENGETPLMYSTRTRDLVTVKKIILVSNVNDTDNKGKTALMHSLGFGDEQIICALILESDIRIVDDEGNTALSIASSMNMSEKLLLRLSCCR